MATRATPHYPISPPSDDHPARNETELERCDRNLSELLQEVRVAQTGIQVLFGFLLAVVFTPRFRAMSGFERIDYFATMLAAAAGAVLLIAPTAHHRILFRLGDKRHLVTIANTFTLLGLGAVALAMVGVVILVSDAMFPSAVTVVVTAFAAAGFATTWFLMPLARRSAIKRPQPPTTNPAITRPQATPRTLITRSSPPPGPGAA
jgi:hypothetical protein